MVGPAPARPLRVTVLTGPYSTTQDAQVQALRDRTGAEVDIVYRRASGDAPFVDDEFTTLEGALAWDDRIPADRVSSRLERLGPDVLLMTSWNHGVYMRLARAWRHRALRLMIMDNPWRSTAKQWAGLAVSRGYIRPAVDVAFVPNERQRVFARKLGFAEDEIWYGAYGCDQPRFEIDPVEAASRPRSFLYVGRLIQQKGVQHLLDAYAAYREQVPEPWPLRMVGTGPLAPLVARADGVVALGFQQPRDMPGVFAAAGCFVLPSTFEPWGTVIHEAAASALPIICTTACGAWLDLVRDGYNGILVAPGRTDVLTEALTTVTNMGDERRRGMGQASVSLSRQLTPQRWADWFDQRVRAWLDRAAR